MYDNPGDKQIFVTVIRFRRTHLARSAKKKNTSCQVIAKADYVSLRAVYRANETRGGCQTSQVTPVCFSIPQRLEIVMEIEN